MTAEYKVSAKLNRPRRFAEARWLDDAVPHRKKSKRKKHALVLEYTGERRDDWYSRALTKTKTIRYETLSAAEDALESWKRGRGIYGFICKPNEWKASII